MQSSPNTQEDPSIPQGQSLAWVSIAAKAEDDSMPSAAADSVDMGVFGFGLTEKTRRSLCLWWMREESRGTYRLVAGGIHGGAGRPGMGSYYLTVPPRARREGARSSRGPYRMWEWKVKMRHGSISNSEFAAARLERLASSPLRKLLAVQHMELTWHSEMHS